MQIAAFPKQIQLCSATGGNIYEIRTLNDADTLYQLMKSDGVEEIYAGLYVNSANRLTFMSDDSPNTYPYFRECYNCPLTPYMDDNYVESTKKQFGDEIHIRYQLNETLTPPIHITFMNHQTSTPCRPLYAYCKQKPTTEGSILTNMAHKICTRDTIEIQRVNEMLQLELIQIMAPGHRVKRGIALAGAGLLGIDALINSFTGASPLSNIGKGIAYTLGIATHADLAITKQELERQAQQLTNITLNQGLLIEAQIEVQNDIFKLRNAQNFLTHEITILFSDMDNKINIYRLQNLVQHTLAKMTTAIQASKQQFPSPYIFGNNDLHNLTSAFRLQGVQLSDNIDDVITSVILVENTYTFIIAVPLLMDTNDFYFYEVITLPIFKDNIGYEVSYTNKYFAVNAVKMEYFTVSAVEYDTCTQYSMCTIAAPFRKMTATTPCEIRSLQHGANQCDLHENPNAQATFYNFGNTTYFSVPKAMNIHLSCKNSQRTFNELQQIVHYGHFNIPDGCQVNIDNEITIKPGFVVTKYYLKDNTLFEILNTPFHPSDFPTTTKSPNTTQYPNIQFHEIGNYKSTIEMVFDHESTLAGVIKFAVYFAIIAAIIAIIYFAYKPFRIWLNTWLLKTKPSVYWSRIRNYETPQYVRRRQKGTKNKKPEDIDAEAPLEPNVQIANFDSLQDKLKQIIEQSQQRDTPPTIRRATNLNDRDAYDVPPPMAPIEPIRPNPYLNFYRLNPATFHPVPEPSTSQNDTTTVEIPPVVNTPNSI